LPWKQEILYIPACGRSPDNREAKMEREKLVAACGLYCGACEIYRAYVNGNTAKLEEVRQGLNARGGTKFTLEDMECDGCVAEGKLNAWCRNCNIRSCAKHKPSETFCSKECADYPCAQLSNFANDGMTHHKEIIDNLNRLQQTGLKKHAAQEEKRWQCPECRQAMSWYDKTCTKCGAPRSEKLFKLEYDWPPKQV
jgi:hypothetical protein